MSNPENPVKNNRWCLSVIVVIAIVSFFGLTPKIFSQSKKDWDGVARIWHGKLNEPSGTLIERIGLAGLPPLPAGYAALNKNAFRITTGAAVSTPHTIHFAVPSVSEETAFRRLRILHINNDRNDPSGYVWRDVTLLDFDKASPVFPARAIFAESERLGVYVIAKLVNETPPSNTVADLVVTSTSAANRLTAPRLITYTIKVVNNGPDTATDVALWNELSRYANFVSAEPGQGQCKDILGYLFCKLGSLQVGQSTTVSVKLEPWEGRDSFPGDGQRMTFIANAAADEKDPKSENNKASLAFLVFPDPNQPPTVTLNSPKKGTQFVGPADITLEASAQDSDGSISKVEFFDGIELLGLGTSVDGKKFVFNARGVSFGDHTFVAVATDNQGRTESSAFGEVFVNGLALASIKSPAPDSLVAPGSDVTLTAMASHASAVINKVQFFVDGRLVGKGRLSEENTYSFNWKDAQRGNHSVAVTVIDSLGISTVSSPVKFTIDKAPEVEITSPSGSERFTASTNISITAKANAAYGFIWRMDFYVDDHLIGTAWHTGSDKFKLMWRNVPEGQHSLKVVAVNDYKASTTSKPITITIEPRVLATKGTKHTK
jgi:uncharacterized repeat protein (TIGR01451 family)